VIGQPEGRSVAMAALCNGIAAHGEDFDDTYEGGPVHAGAVIVPAILATAEMHGLSGGRPRPRRCDRMRSHVPPVCRRADARP
jgi:2-methylcitrate dehydratase PrpD